MSANNCGKRDREKVWGEGRTEMPSAIVLPKVKPYPITE